MYFLEILTITCTGLMTGNELALSLFVNPAIWKLDDGKIIESGTRCTGGGFSFSSPLSYSLFMAFSGR